MKLEYGGSTRKRGKSMCETMEATAKIAPLFTLVVAAAALFVASSQLRQNRNSQRETTAKATFREYLKLAFQHPDLAAGNISGMTQLRFEEYKWFVGYFLWAVEEMLRFAKKDPIWLENIRVQMLAHRAYFRSDEFQSKELSGYNNDLRALVNRVVRTA